MSGDFTVNDKRGQKTKEEEERDAFTNRAPASLEETSPYQKVTPDTCFIRAGRGRYVIQEDDFSYKGRVYIPQRSERRPTTGVIVSVGKPAVDSVGNKIEQDYENGDHVVVGVYAGSVVTFKGWDPQKRINLRICNQDEILGRIKCDAPEVEGVGA